MVKKKIKLAPFWKYNIFPQIIINIALMAFFIFSSFLLAYQIFLTFLPSSPSFLKQNVSVLKPPFSYHAQASSSSKPQPTPTPTPKPASYFPQASGYQLKVPILMYHYIGNNPRPADLMRNSLSVSPNNFEEQMKYLQENGFTTITLDTLYLALKKQVFLPNKAVVLTFDDGYADFYSNAYPILLKYGLRATAFIPTGLIGQGYYLSWSQIKEMSASGLITFGAHSVHHSYLPSLSQEKLEFEVMESKRVLQDALGVPINFFAYPYGVADNRVIKAVEKAGFVGAVGTWASKIQSEGTIYDMPRLRVGNTSLAIFSSLL